MIITVQFMTLLMQSFLGKYGLTGDNWTSSKKIASGCRKTLQWKGFRHKWLAKNSLRILRLKHSLLKSLRILRHTNVLFSVRWCPFTTSKHWYTPHAKTSSLLSIRSAILFHTPRIPRLVMIEYFLINVKVVKLFNFITFYLLVCETLVMN